MSVDVTPDVILHQSMSCVSIGVDDSAVMGGEKSELYRLVRESKDLPIKVCDALSPT